MTETTESCSAQSGKNRINVSLTQFREGTKHYPQADRDLMEWLWGYAFDVLKGSIEDLTQALGCDYKEAYAAFMNVGGKGELSSGFRGAVERLKVQAIKTSTLVKTPVTRRIEEALDYARDRHAMTAIIGPTGRSKTSTVKDWAMRNNHGRARYIRCPSGCSRRTLVTLLAQSCGLGVIGQKSAVLEMRLLHSFSPRNVLIIDEAGHLIPRCNASGTLAIEFLRDLYDSCNCGITLVFTNVYLQEMTCGVHAAYFEQFIGRLEFRYSIPPEVTRGEVRAAVARFRSNPPEKLVDAALSIASAGDGKLRTLFRDLQRAAEFAQANGAELDVGMLRLAEKWRKNGMPEEELEQQD